MKGSPWARNGGPGIIIFGAEGVQIASNYFEGNCQPPAPLWDDPHGRWNDTRFKHMIPALDNGTNPVIEFNADIVLTGCAAFHDGDSDYKRWGPIEFCYGAAYPPQSVTISGGTHAPTTNGSAVLIIAGDGIVLQANEMGRRTLAPAASNIALVETCSDASLCGVRNLFMKANTGFTAVAPSDPTIILNRGQLRLRPTSKPFTGGVGAHSWVFEDPAPLYRPRNMLRGVEPTAWTASGGCSVSKAEGSRQVGARCPPPVEPPG
jgi:hypothetical protein